MADHFKALDKDFLCKNFKYEVGKTYTHGGDVKVCSAGFHACENPFDVLSYYPLVGSRFALVSQSGALSKNDNDSKVASAEITIKAEITLPQFIKHAVDWLVARTKDAATTGYGANAATTGNRANAATTGYGANAATTGYGANAATTGYGANAATTGNGANAATTGNGANAATTGYGANAATTGNGANAATTGYGANAATTGYGANAATTGNGANAATTGANSIACSLGRHGTAKAVLGGWIVVVGHDADSNVAHIFSSKVGENGVEPDVAYRLTNTGALERADKED